MTSCADVAGMVQERCPRLSHVISGSQTFPDFGKKKGGSFSIPSDEEKLCAILFQASWVQQEKAKGLLNHRNLTENAVSVGRKKIPAGTVSMTLATDPPCVLLYDGHLKSTLHRIIICINDYIMHVARNMKLFSRRSCFSFRW